MSARTKSLDPLGVEILDLDLRSELSEEDLAWLRSTVMDVGFALFRDQPLDPQVQLDLGKRFGAIEQLDVNSATEEPSMVVIGNVDREGRVFADDDPRMKLITINEGWHTDSSFRDVPASFSIFSCVVSPHEGGDTFYASLQAGWEALSSEEQAELYALDGIHDYNAAYRRRGNEVGGMVGFDSPPVQHPLVRRHPETGRTGLYVSDHIARVEGLDEAHGRALLERLLSVCTAPERVYRHHWRVGDVAIWDNRSMLHRAQGFDQRFPRVMHHVRVAGNEEPIRASS